jgi:hypothetical protein
MTSYVPKWTRFEPYKLLRTTDAAASQARITVLEVSSQSLARLKTSDVTIESQQERLLGLEKLNRELTSEKQALVSEGRLLCIIYLWG